MTAIVIIKITLCIIAGVLIIVFGYYSLLCHKKWRKAKEKQENDYMMKYIWIKDAMDHWPVSTITFKQLRIHIKDLETFPYKNKEKTQVLNCHFILGRFNSEAVKDCAIRNGIKL
jgi:Na+-transporting NADH:ubiquinone oxidoreductase subunit NqrC